jgi:deoxycytidylate deaminase
VYKNIATYFHHKFKNQKMGKGIDLSHIYQLRNDFTLIGLTGRLSSGCSQIAALLSQGFGDGKSFENPIDIGLNERRTGFKHNSYRKYRIIYKYAKENFKPYSVVKYKDILTIFLLQYPFENFIQFLSSQSLKDLFVESKLNLKVDFSNEIIELNLLKEEFEKFAKEFDAIKVEDIKHSNNWEELYDFYFTSSFRSFSEEFHTILKSKSLLKRNKTLQIIANNIRRSGKPYSSSELSADNIFTIVETINNVVKSHRNKKRGEKTQIVIDSLRNPFEIMFFKQRYSAFYTLAVNREDLSRESILKTKFTEEWDDALEFLKEEYNGGDDNEFYKPHVAECIQQADIHISFLETSEAKEKNEKLETENQKSVSKDITSPYFSWEMQILKYVSLISHPGLVTPSPEERCMQLAHTAKHNSGCISRHVGAAITDEYYSIKAIGWNNTPEGQVPCVLRNAEDLLTNTMDLDAFTNYERKAEFKSVLAANFEAQIQENSANIKGRNVCFCFKSLKNSCSEGKNQVHTRSLHAEESAFLQISKYGGTGIKGGKLFTTASPCELCSKKAYQLGIKVIYYIDPYPGISKEQILTTGSQSIEIRLFNGAIGSTYHWLYDPVMPYKDEMTLLLDNEVKDLTSKYASDLKIKNEKIRKLEKEIADLKKGTVS